MIRKYLFPVGAIILIVGLYFMYRNQHQLYQKTLQANYSLVAHLRELEQRNQQVSQGIQQIQEAQEAGPQLKGTFVDRKKYFRQNWSNYIHVSLNNYKTGFLGGVRNIQVQVSNDTEYPLDNVTANVRYYRANGQLFKTESLGVNTIPPKSSRSVAAPDSRKGMKVALEVQRITSQEMNFCWTANKKKTPGNNDPFQCAPETPGH